MQYYYLNKNSEQAGPADLEQLKKAEITKETLVWKEGMKEWMPAGSIDELKVLFPLVPPPVAAKPVGPPLPPPPPSRKISETRPPAITKKILIGAGALVVLALVAFMVFKPSKESDDDNASIANADSALLRRNDTMATQPEEKKDTVKIIDLDSLSRNLNWGDSTAKTDSVSTGGTPPPFFPGAGTNTNTTRKTKKPSGKKPAKVVPDQQVEEEETIRPTNTERKEPASVNPARYLSISGTYRKNVLFEAVLEGTIQNRHSAQVRDIVVEVWFLDASGQSVGNKRFTQHGPLAAGGSIPFKFKTSPPKGTKGARFDIVAASVK